MTTNLPIIEVNSLSKIYYRGSLRKDDKKINSFSSLLGHVNGWVNKRRYLNEVFTALDNISFSLYEGDVLGVIGRNGAGKSTLLKIISGITTPTCGNVVMRGRVGSLLEVGTGFHPAMTGRQNIYFNGQILGLKKSEIDQQFDDIVKFSGVEQFIDTPVKRYSSGMTVRLGFAVAAHLNPEILIIDEVLAVGDIEFQQKCLGKMKESAESGRTVIFVSHQMSAIENLCNRAILLENGKLMAEGNTGEVVNNYLNRINCDKKIEDLSTILERKGTGECRFNKIWLENSNNEKVDYLRVGETNIAINALIVPYSKIPKKGIYTCVIRDNYGMRIQSFMSEIRGITFILNEPTVITIKIEKIQLKPGIYFCDFYYGVWGGNEPFDFIERYLVLRIEPGIYFEDGNVISDVSDVFYGDYQFIMKK